ncbi:MAG TPA: c-type cytochrome, partial [Ardenticatenaceae bacterium]|nr:c-type cytochrome [Ardenticatenaceae bacterium]
SPCESYIPVTPISLLLVRDRTEDRPTMQATTSRAVKSLVALFSSLSLFLMLVAPALAQEEAAAAAGASILLFLTLLIGFLVGIALLTAGLVAFLMWASGRPIPVLSPLIRDLNARGVDEEGEPSGPTNLQKILIALGGVATLLLVGFVLFRVAPAFIGGQQQAAAATPTAGAVVAAETTPTVESAPAPAPPSDEVVETIQANGCGGCHVIPGTDAAGAVGPSLAGIATRAEETVATPEYTGAADSAEAFIHESIVSPSTFVRPNYPDVMPKNFGETIPEGELEALVAYLATLR